jgi:hypothetical protein
MPRVRSVVKREGGVGCREVDCFLCRIVGGDKCARICRGCGEPAKYQQVKIRVRMAFGLGVLARETDSVA